MTAQQRPTVERGLPSLNEARAERRRQMSVGRFRVRGQLTPHFWLWAGVILAAFSVVYWKITQGQLLSQKSAVMAKQRAIALTLTPGVVPFRDRIERWVGELAGPWRGDQVEPSLALEQVQKAAGVYLRLRINNADGPKSIRKAAEVSLHDGFVSCFFVRVGAPDPSRGPACRSPADCAPGLLCNEYDVCSPPPKPYNMRLAYRALRVLSPEWTDELHQASSDLEVRLHERDLERVVHDDIPIAVQMFQTAKFFTLVLDEEPKEGLPAPLDSKETEEQRVQRVAHWGRVGVWDFATGKLLLHVRGEASARLVPVGDNAEKAALRVENRAAQERQVNSCALALAAKAAAETRARSAVP